MILSREGWRDECFRAKNNRIKLLLINSDSIQKGYEPNYINIFPSRLQEICFR